MLLAATSAAEGENASSLAIYPFSLYSYERGIYDAIVAPAGRYRGLVISCHFVKCNAHSNGSQHFKVVDRNPLTTIVQAKEPG